MGQTYLQLQQYLQEQVLWQAVLRSNLQRTPYSNHMQPLLHSGKQERYYFRYSISIILMEEMETILVLALVHMSLSPAILRTYHDKSHFLKLKEFKKQQYNFKQGLKHVNPGL